MAFRHLHVHTEYSLLDGSSKIGELVDRAKQLGMDSIAITDHGVMYGVFIKRRIMQVLNQLSDVKCMLHQVRDLTGSRAGKMKGITILYFLQRII